MAEVGPVLLPVLFDLLGLQLGDEERDLRRHAPDPEPGVGARGVRRRQRLERPRVLEREPVGQRCGTGGTRDAVVVVRRPGTDPDMVHRPRRRAGWGGNHGLTLPDPGDGPQRRIGVVGIQIDDRLEQHVGHAVEPDRVVAEPGPGQSRGLAAAEAVLGGPTRIVVVQVGGNRRIAPGDLRRPVGDHLAVDPRHDLGRVVVGERRHQPRLRGLAGRGVGGCVGSGTAPASGRRDAGRERDADDMVERGEPHADDLDVSGTPRARTGA